MKIKITHGQHADSCAFPFSPCACTCPHGAWDGDRCAACGATTFPLNTPRTPDGRFTKEQTKEQTR